jgi:Ca-activated chloride channel family protein
MLAGTRASRLDAVKEVFRSFVTGSGEGDLPGRPYDEIGIVAFGGFAVSRAPLTLDHAALNDMLSEIEIPRQIVDERGRVLNREEFNTAIGDGLALSVARLKDSIASSRVVILLSDGRSNAGDVEPEAAARAAKEFGIKVYTIGIFHDRIAPMPFTDPLTGRKSYRSVPVDFDEGTLKEIARITGGRYFHADNTERLQEVYAEIDEMEKTEIESRVFMRYKELFAPLLELGIVLLFVETLLAYTYLRRIP